jgi:hypothetical protein
VIPPRKRSGRIDTVVRYYNRIYIKGWVHAVAQNPVRTVVVFHGKQFLHAIILSATSPDNSKTLSEPVSKAEFETVVDVYQAKPQPGDMFRVLALTENGAFEIGRFSWTENRTNLVIRPKALLGKALRYSKQRIKVMLRRLRGNS